MFVRLRSTKIKKKTNINFKIFLNQVLKFTIKREGVQLIKLQVSVLRKFDITVGRF